MLNIPIWLWLMLGQFGVNVYTDCVPVENTEFLLELICEVPNGSVFPVIVEGPSRGNTTVSQSKTRKKRKAPTRSRNATRSRRK